MPPATTGLCPEGVVTCTFTAPAAWAGAVTCSDVFVTFVLFFPAEPPHETPVGPTTCVPVIVTTVPPAVGPLAGESDVIAGAGGSVYVNGSALLVPPAVTTVTWAAPTAWAGTVALTLFASTTNTLVAGTLSRQR